MIFSRFHLHCWLGAVVALLTACDSVQPQAVSYSVNQTTLVSDSSGWYRFSGFAFKGNVVNGKPDGRGTCRTEYENARITEEACEFLKGVRVDAAYLNATSSIHARATAQRERDARDAYEREQERIEEHNRQVRELDRGLANIYLNSVQNMNAAADQMAEENKKLNRLANEARKQKEEQARQAQREKDLEAQRTRDANDLAARMKADEERNRRSEQTSRNMYDPVSNGPATSKDAGYPSGGGSLSGTATAYTQDQLKPMSNQKSSDTKPNRNSGSSSSNSAQMETVVGYGKSEYCYSQNHALDLAYTEAKNDASETCTKLGNLTWLGKKTFPGYQQCEPCKGSEKGNYRCTVEKVVYECFHK